MTTLAELRSANRKRQAEWPGNDRADVSFRAIEFAGESGELMESIKKWLRSQREIKGTVAALDDIRDEMGDALVSLDLLADELGIDLGDAVARKFNKTSAKYGLQTRLPEASRTVNITISKDDQAFACVPRHLVKNFIDLRAAVENEDEVSPALYAHLEDAEKELLDAAIDDIT